MSPDTLELVKLSLQAIIAVSAIVASVYAYLAKKAIQDVHVSLNSRLTQLLEQTAASSRAEGRDSMRPNGELP